MSPHRKMLSDWEAPYIKSIVKLMETQSKATLALWAVDYAEQVMLPLWSQLEQADTRPQKALNAAREWLSGTVKLPQAKTAILACHAAAREAEGNPIAQAAARAIGQSTSTIHSASHGIGLALYGALAVAYDKLGTDAPWTELERCAAGECGRMETALRTIAVTGEPNPAKINVIYPFTERFISDTGHAKFLKTAMMGPNALRITEELTSLLGIEKNMRILDLGCGCGLSTLLLVKKYKASVFAADLWISPTENYKRFLSTGIDDKAIPISADATKDLPFANRYFDLLLSVDAYHYFGDTPEMLPKLISFIKKGGYIAVAVPGLKYEFGKNVPDEMQPFWNTEMERTLHSPDWWKALWEKTEGIEITDVREMACCRQAWEEWLDSGHPVAAEDISMMTAEGGKYFNLIQLIAKVI